MVSTKANHWPRTVTLFWTVDHFVFHPVSHIDFEILACQEEHGKWLSCFKNAVNAVFVFDIRTAQKYMTSLSTAQPQTPTKPCKPEGEFVLNLS